MSKTERTPPPEGHQRLSLIQAFADECEFRELIRFSDHGEAITHSGHEYELGDITELDANSNVPGQALVMVLKATPLQEDIDHLKAGLKDLFGEEAYIKFVETKDINTPNLIAINFKGKDASQHLKKLNDVLENPGAFISALDGTLLPEHFQKMLNPDIATMAIKEMAGHFFSPASGEMLTVQDNRRLDIPLPTSIKGNSVVIPKHFMHYLPKDTHLGTNYGKKSLVYWLDASFFDPDQTTSHVKKARVSLPMSGAREDMEERVKQFEQALEKNNPNCAPISVSLAIPDRTTREAINRKFSAPPIAALVISTTPENQIRLDELRIRLNVIAEKERDDRRLQMKGRDGRLTGLNVEEHTILQRRRWSTGNGSGHNR